jgi:EpsD family peptidyl-prolyl cis-trans isomerase
MLTASFTAPRPLLLALAAGVALSLAACGESKKTEATQVAAKVGKEEISVHQINYILERQQGLKPEQLDGASRQVLEGLIDQEIAVQRAHELKLDREPRVLQSLEAARRDVLARAYVEQVGAGVAKPTTAEVRSYYDSKPALFKERRVYALEELLVQANAEQLAALRERVTGAKNMAEVTAFIQAQKMPARASQNVAAAEALPLQLLDQFAKMKPGQALFLPAQGGARIVVINNIKEEPATLEQATPMIERALYNERRGKAVDTDRKALRTATEVAYLGKFTKPAAEAASAPAAAPASAATATSNSASAVSLDSSSLDKGLAGLK